MTILVATLLLAACAGSYKGVPRVEMLRLHTAPTYGALYDMASAYATALDAALDADTLHPGMYADYGVALALMGHHAEANRMLCAESKAFPQSRLMVERIRQHLLPDYAADTLGSRPNRQALEGWAYDSAAALQPYWGLLPVIDSTDSVRVMMQTPVDSGAYPARVTARQKRLMLEEEQQRESKRLKQEADSIAAAKQAVVDARKQAKADKAKAKKAAEKAKKQAAKEKERLRKEQQKQRERERAERRAQQEAARKAKQKKQ